MFGTLGQKNTIGWPPSHPAASAAMCLVLETLEGFGGVVMGGPGKRFEDRYINTGIQGARGRKHEI